MPFAMPPGRAGASPARRGVGARHGPSSGASRARPSGLGVTVAPRRRFDRLGRVVELLPVADGQRQISQRKGVDAVVGKRGDPLEVPGRLGHLQSGGQQVFAVDPDARPAARRPMVRTARSRPRGAGRRCRCRRCGCRTGRRGSAGPSPSTRYASRGSPRPTGWATSRCDPRRLPSTARSRRGRACLARPRHDDRPAAHPACCPTARRTTGTSRRRSRRSVRATRRRGRHRPALAARSSISGMCSVARGNTCAGRMFTSASSSWNPAS